MNERKTKFDSLLADLPTEPVSFPDFTSWLGLQVKYEHWVRTSVYQLQARDTLTSYAMRELGYNDPVPYDGKIKGVYGVYMTTRPP
jgi:hypothetical protein